MNWHLSAEAVDYFHSGEAARPLDHLWSLAVEEQFYLLWPLLLPLFLLLRRARWRAIAAASLAAASAAWMITIVATGGDVTRAYFGTDTHSFGILLGVGIAFLLDGPLQQPQEWMLLPRVRIATGAAGVLAIAALFALATQTAATFPGALLAASLLSGVAVVAGVWPRSSFGPGLDRRPLRWVGARSYGIYLWHWPILILLLAASGVAAGEAPPWIGAVALVLTIAVSELSFRLVETPVRRHGFRASAGALGRRLSGTPVARFRAIVAVVVAAAMLGGTSAAIAAAPDATSGETAVLAGADALEDAQSRATDAATPPPSETPVGASLRPPTAATDVPAPGPSPTPVTGDEITAVGDSVMLAAAPALLERYPGIQVDAAVSRSSWAGPGILQSLADTGQLRSYIVLALGTNGPLDAGSLEKMFQIAGPDRHVVLVNAFAPRDWIPGVNAELTALAASHPGTVVADWSGAIAGHTDLLAGDQIHPGTEGGRIFADTVAAAVAQAEADRAMRAYRADQWAQAVLRLTLPAGS
jgi:peptidoglycan/LPS O-acetylase OafA/YrhL